MKSIKEVTLKVVMAVNGKDEVIPPVFTVEQKAEGSPSFGDKNEQFVFTGHESFVYALQAFVNSLN